jgi:hypothetical protein
MAQSIQQLATGWTVWGWDPSVGEIFHTHPDRPWGTPRPPIQWGPDVSWG